VRISIRGGYFSGPPELDAYCTQMKAVIVHASRVHRSYFAGEYQPEGNQLPACWSTDTERPALQVPAATRQSGRCIDCTQNIRGSAIGGNGRACRFFQLLAIAFEHDLNTVHRLQVPSASIFGKSNSNMSLEAYSRFLAKHGTPSATVVTKIYFDTTSNMPRLCFAPSRALRTEELDVVREVVTRPSTLNTITFEVVDHTQSPFPVSEGFEIKETYHG